MLLRDRFWLWGHPEGRYNDACGNHKPSRMTPMEACLYLGIKKTFMLPLDVEVSMRQYNKSFKTLNEVAWPCTDEDYVFDLDQKPELIEPIIQEAKDFKNITGVVFDDFQRDGKYKEINVDNLFRIRDRLHNNEVRPLDMWMVLYINEFGYQPGEHEIYDDVRFQPYIEPFDGVIMWTWEEREVPQIPEKYEIFKKMTEGKRRMFGCYLWNFGERKEATAEAVTWQLDWYREKILAGEAEGVVLHTNTMADLDYEAYDAACEWMDEHGDEIVPQVKRSINFSASVGGKQYD